MQLITLVIFPLLAFFVYVFIAKYTEKNRTAIFKMSIPKSNPTKILNRKNELGAIAGLELMNLSGIDIPADATCGIYMFRKSILFEADDICLEIQFSQLSRVFIDAHRDMTFAHQQNEKRRRTTYPFLSLYPHHPSSNSVTPEPDYVVEYSLVFEVQKDGEFIKYIVFAFSDKQLNEIEDFVQLYNEVNMNKQNNKSGCN